LGRLTDHLAALGQTTRRTLGFGRAEQPRHNAAILLIAEAAVAEPESRLRETAAFVDAFVLNTGVKCLVPPSSTLDALEGKTWGIGGCCATPEDMDALKDAGCDFIVVADDDAPATILRDDGMARGFAIRPGLSDERARALDDLPFEFLVLEPDEESWPISVAGLLRLQDTVSMVSKHIFLKVNQLPSADSLALLRDMPVSGLLLDLSVVDRAALEEERKAVDGLEPRKPRQPLDQTPTLAAPPGMGIPCGADPSGEEDWDGEIDGHARPAAGQ